jgi:hypothetical protein
MLLTHPDSELEQRNCTLNSTVSICGTYRVPFAFNGIKLYYPTLSLKYGNDAQQLLYRFKNPMLGYQTSIIQNFGPYASLNRNYPLEIFFQNSILATDTLLQNEFKEYYCKANGSSIEYTAQYNVANSDRTLSCTIHYFGVNEITFNVFLRIGKVSNQSVLLNENPIIGYFASILIFYSIFRPREYFFHKTIPSSILLHFCEY